MLSAIGTSLTVDPKFQPAIRSLVHTLLGFSLISVLSHVFYRLIVLRLCLVSSILSARPYLALRFFVLLCRMQACHVLYSA